MATITTISLSVIPLFSFEKDKAATNKMIDGVTSGGNIPGDVDALKDMLIHQLDRNTIGSVNPESKGCP